MNVVALWAWLLSLAGAALFFAAGRLWALRAMAHASRAPNADDELAQTRSERDQLRTELGKMERLAREAGARARRHRREVDELLAELRSKAKPRRALPVVLDPGARGEALRDILDQETSGNGFTGAVIADELGLIVASTGEFGDALAAYGAFLAGVGDKTRSVLPLHALRQLVIQDDHDTTLTVRPIVSADDHLALVTLAPGRLGAATTGTATEKPS